MVGLREHDIIGEVLVPALVLLLLALLLRARRTQRMRDWAVCGFGAALVTLFRQELLPIIVPLAAWCVLVSEQGRRIKATAAVVACFLTPWLCIGFINTYYHGRFMITGNALYYALFSGLGQIPNDYGAPYERYTGRPDAPVPRTSAPHKGV